MLYLFHECDFGSKTLYRVRNKLTSKDFGGVLDRRHLVDTEMDFGSMAFA